MSEVIRNMEGTFKIQQPRRQPECRLKSKFCVLSVFIAIILPTYFVKCRRTLLKLTEFQGAISKFRKRDKISSLLIYVLGKTRN